MTLIKICGIKDPEMALKAALAGADWIGILCVPTSKRYIPLAIAREIAEAAKEGGAKVCAVVVGLTREEIAAVVEACKPDALQTDRPLQEFGDGLTYFYVNFEPLSPRGQDYLLVDNIVGGSGELLNWPLLKGKEKMPWFLAGGLNAENVHIALNILRPTGVDVSSGVEERGMKNLSLIKSFIEGVRTYV